MQFSSGVILVGPPGSGKTSTYQVLAQILNQLHEDSLQDEANAFDQTVGAGAESTTDGEDTESSALSSVMLFYLISS